jgi:hypothetical protein
MQEPSKVIRLKAFSGVGWHNVDLDKKTCNCSDFSTTGYCRHLKGFLSSPVLGKAYIVTGILVLLVTGVCVVSASGEDRIWQASIPGRWPIFLGYTVVVVLNVGAWIAGHHYYRQE